MICLAMFATDAFVIGLMIGALAGGAAACLVAAFDRDNAPGAGTVEPQHECPFCGRILRAITVHVLDDIDDPVPPSATWICPNVACDVYYFADLPAGKPAAVEEV